MAWQLNARAALHWQRWDDEWVVFDEGSGQTFLTDAVTAASLLILEAGPVARAELDQEVARALGMDDVTPIEERIGSGLDFLSGLGLVESMPSSGP
jgi:PqqD family protein of HPr-rel-A system